MAKQNVIVSACLLGEACRYDGASRAHAGVIDFLRDKTVIPFCPEAPVLGTPRGRISVIETKTQGLRVRRDTDGEDVTDALIGQSEQLLTSHPDADMVILKSKSPSCGLGTTPILDETGKVIRKGDGIAAAYILHACNKITIKDETAF